MIIYYGSQIYCIQTVKTLQCKGVVFCENVVPLFTSLGPKDHVDYLHYFVSVVVIC